MLGILPRWIVWSLLLSMVFRGELRAQFGGATVMGVVQDSSKAFIPSAKLKLLNNQTGAENDSVATREGSFVLPGVLAGSYTLQVESNGFATTQVRGITLAEGDTKTLLIRMRVGPVAETVNVDASGLLMNTTTGSVSMVADRELAESLPLNGRSFPDLYLATPGIVTQNRQAAGRGDSTGRPVECERSATRSEFVLRRRRGRQCGPGGCLGGISARQHRLDRRYDRVGHDPDAGSGRCSGGASCTHTSTYSAEYGRTPCGQFNFLTRSGMDGFHGSASGYYRRDTLDSIDYFQSTQSYTGQAYKSMNLRKFDQFDSAATLGGPLLLPWVGNAKRKGYRSGLMRGSI